MSDSKPMHPADELFHKLWTKAVGTKDYDKKQWKDLQAFIDKLVAKEKAKEKEEQAKFAHDFEKYH